MHFKIEAVMKIIVRIIKFIVVKSIITATKLIIVVGIAAAVELLRRSYQGD